MLDRKNIWNGHRGSCSWFHKWKPTSRELLAFLGLTISMGLISKSRMETFLEKRHVTDAPISARFSKFGTLSTKTKIGIDESLINFEEYFSFFIHD